MSVGGSIHWRMPVTFKHKRLGNGLTIIAEVDPEAASSACGFFVKTGARDEPRTIMGVSHFLEHMMFKGTAELTADDINRGFDRIGARNNAYTSNEMTCFYAHVLPERLEEGTELLGRMMRPALREEDFNTEKGVILEEIAMYQDNPFWVLYEATTEKHFGSHPLSHRVLGTKETIAALPRDAMAGYFQSRYSADNTIVALAGKLDFEKVCDQVERLCGTWTSTGPTRDNREPPLAGGELHLREAKVTRGYLLALCKAPSVADESRYAAAMLAQILGSPDNSRLHWSLIETGLAEEAQASFDPHDGFGEFFIFASGDPGRLGEIRGVVERELAGLADSLTKDDLDRLVSKAVTAATVGGERPHDRMHRLGRIWTYMGRYVTLDEELDRISKVGLDDLRETLGRFPMRPVTVGTLQPE